MLTLGNPKLTYLVLPSAEAIQFYEESLPAPSQDSGPLRRSSRLQGVYVYSDFAMPLFDDDPVSRSQALSSPFAEQWIEAEIDELRSIQEMGVWTLVDFKPGMHVLGSKFVYKTKRNPDGTVQKHKVRLVAQGFGQKEGLDYQDVFATTVAWQSIRIVFWLATFYRLFLAKVDIKTFFLYGELQETIYMRQPPGYQQGNKVCKLLKSLYGLKKSMRCALETLTDALALQHLIPLATDPNVFFRKCSEGVLIVCAWVDDLLVVASTEALFDKFVSALKKSFKLTGEREPEDYLQMQVCRDVPNKRLKMHQGGYARKLLESFQMQNANPSRIPFVCDTLPVPSDVVPDEECRYMELVGSLIWMLRTRPDLQIYVNKLTRYMTRHNRDVYSTALKVLKYIRGTIDDGIVYDMSSSGDFEYGQGVVCSFEVDSNWGGSLHDSKSVTGWLLKLNDSVVGSQTKNQSRPAISSLEAEFNGLEFVCRELEWTCDFLAELKINVPKPVQVFQDNMGALALAKDPIMRPRTKYFRISQHYVRWCRMVGKVDFYHRAGRELVADMLTKPLGLVDFTRHRKVLMGPQDQEWPNRVEEEKEE